MALRQLPHLFWEPVRAVAYEETVLGIKTAPSNVFEILRPTFDSSITYEVDKKDGDDKSKLPPNCEYSVVVKNKGMVSSLAAELRDQALVSIQVMVDAEVAAETTNFSVEEPTIFPNESWGATFAVGPNAKKVKFLIRARKTKVQFEISVARKRSAQHTQVVCLEARQATAQNKANKSDLNRDIRITHEFANSGKYRAYIEELTPSYQSQCLNGCNATVKIMPCTPGAKEEDAFFVYSVDQYWPTKYWVSANFYVEDEDKNDDTSTNRKAEILLSSPFGAVSRQQSYVPLLYKVVIYKVQNEIPPKEVQVEEEELKKHINELIDRALNVRNSERIKLYLQQVEHEPSSVRDVVRISADRSLRILKDFETFKQQLTDAFRKRDKAALAKVTTNIEDHKACKFHDLLALAQVLLDKLDQRSRLSIRTLELLQHQLKDLDEAKESQSALQELTPKLVNSIQLTLESFKVLQKELEEQKREAEQSGEASSSTSLIASHYRFLLELLVSVYQEIFHEKTEERDVPAFQKTGSRLLRRLIYLSKTEAELKSIIEEIKAIHSGSKPAKALVPETLSATNEELEEDVEFVQAVLAKEQTFDKMKKFSNYSTEHLAPFLKLVRDMIVKKLNFVRLQEEHCAKISEMLGGAQSSALELYLNQYKASIPQKEYVRATDAMRYIKEVKPKEIVETLKPNELKKIRGILTSVDRYLQKQENPQAPQTPRTEPQSPFATSPSPTPQSPTPTLQTPVQPQPQVSPRSPQPTTPPSATTQQPPAQQQPQPISRAPTTPPPAATTTTTPQVTQPAPQKAPEPEPPVSFFFSPATPKTLKVYFLKNIGAAEVIPLFKKAATDIALYFQAAKKNNLPLAAIGKESESKGYIGALIRKQFYPALLAVLYQGIKSKATLWKMIEAGTADKPEISSVVATVNTSVNMEDLRGMERDEANLAQVKLRLLLSHLTNKHCVSSLFEHLKQKKQVLQEHYDNFGILLNEASTAEVTKFTGALDKCPITVDTSVTQNLYLPDAHEK